MGGFAAAVDLGLRNPFGLPPGQWSEALDALSDRAELERLARPLAARGAGDEVERLVLAHAHAHACKGADGSVVAALAALPDWLVRALPRPRPSYVALSAAAARCRDALLVLEGASAAMVEVRRATWAACFGDSLVHALTLASVIHDHDVLLLGETGTGKEAIAHAIQEGSIGPADGSPGPRAALNAAAVPDTLVEAELFGHAKGAYTGATEARIGRIRGAHGGTFFLDEVGDLAVTTQVKLLRVIETDEISPLGSDKTHVANCRYVAATHKDLDAAVEAGTFRRDLYQRLAGTVIRLPPLRERPEDIAPIGRAFVARHLPEGALSATRARIDEWLESAEARRHAWLGNVRELQNALRNLLLGLDAGLAGAPAKIASGPGAELPRAIADCTATLNDVEEWYLARVLAHTNDNFAHASRILAVDRTTVRRRARGAKA